MLTITTNTESATATVSVSGRLDTNTAPQLEAELKLLSGITTLILDFENLEYISSAGLRVLLSVQKRMTGGSKLKITHVKEAVMEIFEVTGFSDILDIE